MKEIKFSVNMKISYMYNFMLRHNYTSIPGIIGLMISIGAAVFLAYTFNEQDNMGKAVFFLIALMWTIINPLILHNNAVRQVKTNPSYKKPLEYTFSEEGITVAQGEQQETVPWDRLVKVVRTKKQLIIYSSKIHAFIFPLAEIGDKLEALDAMILSKVEGKQIKLSSIYKKELKK